MNAGLIAIPLTIALVLAIGLLGRTRRIGFWGAILAFVLLTPILGFAVTLLSGPSHKRRLGKSHGTTKNGG